jgi:hypothetical protein
MSLTYIGNTFNIKDQWGPQEVELITNLSNQIEQKFLHQENLLINLTWFGPQFNNNSYQQVLDLACSSKKFDNLFWLSSVDPIYLLPDQIANIESMLGIECAYYIGGFENSPHYFSFSSVATSQDFLKCSDDQILLTDPKYLYLFYNRKPKPHRIELVEKIYKNNLQSHGIVTLGKNDVDYDVSNGIKTDLYLTVKENVNDYTYNNRFQIHNSFGGIPYDLLSLGRLDIWQNHFLNIASETEFLPWDNLFITEKTWKPIIGLRPFLINGQTKIYKYLRDNGFKTFTHWFDGIDLEDLPEYKVHDSIIAAIKFLQKLPTAKLKQLYQDMLPDLRFNQQRFYEFAQEQQYKMTHLFQ